MYFVLIDYIFDTKQTGQGIANLYFKYCTAVFRSKLSNF